MQDPNFYSELGRSLGIRPLCKEYIPEEEAVEAMTNATLLQFHSHVTFAEKRPMRQYLNLGLEPPFTRSSGFAKIPAEKVFGIALHPSALVLVIGCRSGRAQASNTDDLLGLSTAFFYSGAAAVISTLWKITPEDGMRFIEKFHRSLRQKIERAGTRSRLLDVAAVMQTTIVALQRNEDGGQLAPYRWGGFTLSGSSHVPLAFVG